MARKYPRQVCIEPDGGCAAVGLSGDRRSAPAALGQPRAASRRSRSKLKQYAAKQLPTGRLAAHFIRAFRDAGRGRRPARPVADSSHDRAPGRRSGDRSRAMATSCLSSSRETMAERHSRSPSCSIIPSSSTRWRMLSEACQFSDRELDLLRQRDRFRRSPAASTVECATLAETLASGRRGRGSRRRSGRSADPLASTDRADRARCRTFARLGRRTIAAARQPPPRDRTRQPASCADRRGIAGTAGAPSRFAVGDGERLIAGVISNHDHHGLAVVRVNSGTEIWRTIATRSSSMPLTGPAGNAT